MSWKSALKQGNKIIIATCSNERPHAIVVISLGFVGENLLLGACLMKTTLWNIRRNGKVSIVSGNGGWYCAEGKAKIYSSKEWMDIAIKRSKPPLPKYAIVVEISKVFDLDKVKRVF